mgnify:FL=1
MVEIISKLYGYLLWFMGEPLSASEYYPQGEKYTFKLRRQKERLGRYWYLLWAAIIASVLFNLIRYIGKKRLAKVILWSLVVLFLIWLLPHIFGVW